MKLDLPIDSLTVRKLAIEADVDPRTVIHAFQAFLGRRAFPRGRPGERVRKTLERHGYGDLAEATSK